MKIAIITKTIKITDLITMDANIHTEVSTILINRRTLEAKKDITSKILPMIIVGMPTMKK